MVVVYFGTSRAVVAAHPAPIVVAAYPAHAVIPAHRELSSLLIPLPFPTAHYTSSVIPAHPAASVIAAHPAALSCCLSCCFE